MKYLLGFMFLALLSNIATWLFPFGLIVLGVLGYAGGMVIRPTLLLMLGITMALPESVQPFFSAVMLIATVAAILVRCLGGFTQSETNGIASSAGFISGFLATMAFLKRR